MTIYVKFYLDGQGTQRRRKIAENFNRMSRVHERYRQTTDDRQTTEGRITTYSEREREFTFAKNGCNHFNIPRLRNNFPGPLSLFYAASTGFLCGTFLSLSI